jgi:hypothetical protein
MGGRTLLGLVSAFRWASSLSVVDAGLDVWTPIGPEGAIVYALAIDPLTPATLYTGTFGGGVFAITITERNPLILNSTRAGEDHLPHARTFSLEF